MLVVFILVVVKFFISDYSVGSFSREEVTSYECGFEQNSLARVPLSIRYFMLTLVFLLFDLEVMLLVFTPLDFSIGFRSYYVGLVSVGFILILFAGLLFE